MKLPKGEAANVRPRQTDSTPLFLTVGEITKMLTCSRRWLERERVAKRFPKPDMHVGVSPRWRRKTIEAWLDAFEKPRRKKSK